MKRAFTIVELVIVIAIIAILYVERIKKGELNYDKSKVNRHHHSLRLVITL